MSDCGFLLFGAREACSSGAISRKDIMSETNGSCVYIGALGLGQVNERKAFRSFAAVSPGRFGKVPFTDEERRKYPEIEDAVSGHGQYWKSSDGKIWRYQQIAEGMWQGVLAEEWDDSIHLKNEGAIDDLADDAVGDNLETE